MACSIDGLPCSFYTLERLRLLVEDDEAGALRWRYDDRNTVREFTPQSRLSNCFSRRAQGGIFARPAFRAASDRYGAMSAVQDSPSSKGIASQRMAKAAISREDAGPYGLTDLPGAVRRSHALFRRRRAANVGDDNGGTTGQ
jgi:hypothetical protein